MRVRVLMCVCHLAPSLFLYLPSSPSTTGTSLFAPCDEKSASRFPSCVAFSQAPPGEPSPPAPVMGSAHLGSDSTQGAAHYRQSGHPPRGSLGLDTPCPAPPPPPCGDTLLGSPCPSCCGSPATGSGAARSHGTLCLKNTLIQGMSRRGKA